MLTQTAEYALRAACCLAAEPPEGLVPTTTLAERAQVPSNYLAKVLQTLASASLIVGRRGVGGGYRLARPAGEITLLEIIDAVSPARRQESAAQAAAETGSGNGGAEVLAALNRRMDSAAGLYIEQFRDVTLEDVVSEIDAGGPLCCAGSGGAAMPN